MYDYAIEQLERQFLRLLEDLKDSKPNDRSEKDRHFAILITELEKSYAYFRFFLDVNREI